MNINELLALFDSFHSEAFRLELLDHYDVSQESENFKDFRSGKPLPNETQSSWRNLIAAQTARGKHMCRVHILPDKLTPYLRFEIEWGYLHSATAGEEIYLVEAASLEPELLARAWAAGDFWLFDNEIGVKMNYDEDGHFVEPVEAPKDRVTELVTLKTTLLEQAIPLQQYLSQIRNS